VNGYQGRRPMTNGGRQNLPRMNQARGKRSHRDDSAALDAVPCVQVEGDEALASSHAQVEAPRKDVRGPGQTGATGSEGASADLEGEGKRPAAGLRERRMPGPEPRVDANQGRQLPSPQPVHPTRLVPREWCEELSQELPVTEAP
jgi:hypothetical protein